MQAAVRAKQPRNQAISGCLWAMIITIGCAKRNRYGRRAAGRMELRHKYSKRAWESWIAYAVSEDSVSKIAEDSFSQIQVMHSPLCIRVELSLIRPFRTYSTINVLLW